MQSRDPQNTSSRGGDKGTWYDGSIRPREGPVLHHEIEYHPRIERLIELLKQDEGHEPEVDALLADLTPEYLSWTVRCMIRNGPDIAPSFRRFMTLISGSAERAPDSWNLIWSTLGKEISGDSNAAATDAAITAFFMEAGKDPTIKKACTNAAAVTLCASCGVYRAPHLTTYAAERVSVDELVTLLKVETFSTSSGKSVLIEEVVKYYPDKAKVLFDHALTDDSMPSANRCEVVRFTGTYHLENFGPSLKRCAEIARGPNLALGRQIFDSVWPSKYSGRFQLLVGSKAQDPLVRIGVITFSPRDEGALEQATAIVDTYINDEDPVARHRLDFASRLLSRYAYIVTEAKGPDAAAVELLRILAHKSLDEDRLRSALDVLNRQLVFVRGDVEDASEEQLDEIVDPGRLLSAIDRLVSQFAPTGVEWLKADREKVASRLLYYVVEASSHGYKDNPILLDVHRDLFLRNWARNVLATSAAEDMDSRNYLFGCMARKGQDISILIAAADIFRTVASMLTAEQQRQLCIELRQAKKTSDPFIRPHLQSIIDGISTNSVKTDSTSPEAPSRWGWLKWIWPSR